MVRQFGLLALGVVIVGCSTSTKTKPAGPSSTKTEARPTSSASPKAETKKTLLDWEPSERVVLKLWHTYRDKEREALTKAVELFNSRSSRVELVSNYTPYDGYENKLRITIDKGKGTKGPDLFIDAHDKLGSYTINKMVAPLNTLIDDASLSGFGEFVGRAMMQQSNLYGLPLALKPLAVFYNKKFVQSVPASMEQFIATLKPLQARQRKASGSGSTADKDGTFYGFVYEAGNLFYHGQWLSAYGGVVLDDELRPMLDTRAQEQALAFARSLSKEHGFIPVGIDGNMLVSYFNNNQAAAVISGPWLRASINPEIEYGVAPIPTLADKVSKPFVTVEGVFVSRASKHLKAAARAALFLASAEYARIRWLTQVEDEERICLLEGDNESTSVIETH